MEGEKTGFRGTLRLGLLLLYVMLLVYTDALKTYDMDELANCNGRTIIVDDGGVALNGRGQTSPSNPPTTCIIYLQSTYRENDGTNKLQMEVLTFFDRGCEVKVNIYSGRSAVGRPFQYLGCDNVRGKLAPFYSPTNELTVRMTRPERPVHNEYSFSLLFKPWKDLNATPTAKNVDHLSIGAIIGIIIGCLVLIGFLILFCWCCCTGRLGNFNIPGRSIKEPFGTSSQATKKSASVVGGPNKPGVLNLDDPNVWNSAVTGRYEPGRNSQRYQNGQNRDNNTLIGRRFEKGDLPPYSKNRMSGHDYEPYDVDDREKSKDYDRYQNQQYKPQQRSPKETRQPRKETMIDDVFESDSNKGSEKTEDTDFDEATLQKRSLGKKEPVEEETLERGSPQLQRYLSMELESQPDQDTISSQLHINAAVRASVEDDDHTPSGSLRKKKKGDKSPKSKRKDTGKAPDPMAMPPEAFEPIFTKPITGIDYQGSNRNLYGQPQGFPGGFVPYGLIPTGAFAPGTQTYAYAYQTVPQQGAPGQQGAWFVQNTPTTDGNRRTAFAVQETISPDRHVSTPERKRRKNSDPFRKGGNRGNKDSAPDLSIIARGAAPPDPGQGHRSIEMKSGTDPDNKVHTTQVTWTDTVPDVTDPKPDDNPQITRKTITRVTTKSGHGDLPQHATLLALDDADPAFLAPSSQHHTPQPSRAILPGPSTPASENLAYYTGDQHIVPPPERSATPTSTHSKPTYNHAIRDRIPLDSTL